MAIIGITGGIASGKTTFCALLAKKISADIFDADAAARDLLENDEQVRKKICKEISNRAYSSDGKPNRAEIRQIIYNDPTAKARLEGILHPLIRKRWIKQTEDPVYQTRHFIVDIPLLFENNAQRHFHHIVTVGCSESIQLERIAARGVEPVMARKIIQAQLSISEKMARSTYVVWNDGDLVILQEQASFLASLIP